MDRLHATLSALRSETKSETKAARDPFNDPLNVFREFLAQLDALQRKPPLVKAPRVKAQLRRKPARRGRG
jgi:hypothetical protein